jgi:hypothetical protein
MAEMWAALAEHKPAPEYAAAWQMMLRERTWEAAKRAKNAAEAAAQVAWESGAESAALAAWDAHSAAAEAAWDVKSAAAEVVRDARRLSRRRASERNSSPPCEPITQDQIKEWANKSVKLPPSDDEPYSMTLNQLERFVVYVSTAERRRLNLQLPCKALIVEMLGSNSMTTTELAAALDFPVRTTRAHTHVLYQRGILERKIRLEAKGIYEYRATGESDMVTTAWMYITGRGVVPRVPRGGDVSDG